MVWSLSPEGEVHSYDLLRNAKGNSFMIWLRFRQYDHFTQRSQRLGSNESTYLYQSITFLRAVGHHFTPDCPSTTVHVPRVPPACEHLEAGEAVEFAIW